MLHIGFYINQASSFVQLVYSSDHQSIATNADEMRHNFRMQWLDKPHSKKIIRCDIMMLLECTSTEKSTIESEKWYYYKCERSRTTEPFLSMVWYCLHLTQHYLFPSVQMFYMDDPNEQSTMYRCCLLKGKAMHCRLEVALHKSCYHPHHAFFCKTWSSDIVQLHPLPIVLVLSAAFLLTSNTVFISKRFIYLIFQQRASNKSASASCCHYLNEQLVPILNCWYSCFQKWV